MISNITNRTDPNSVKSRVFVGNLNTVQMTKIELESVFARYGPIIGISVHKGYAFVQYASEISARGAVRGEDSKQYYNMILDVTIASEPKNRKRGRSNINPCPGLSELALQAHALSTSFGNPASKHPMLSLRKLGAGSGAGTGGGTFEGIMGQPDLTQFAAAAGVFGGSSSSQISPSAVVASTNYHHQSQPQHYPRSKSSRPIGQFPGAPLSATSSSSLSLSGAKRTRLEATAMGGPAGSSRGSHNLVPLESSNPYEQGGSRSRHKSSLRSVAPPPQQRHYDYEDRHHHMVSGRTRSPRPVPRGPFRPSTQYHQKMDREASGDRLRRRPVAGLPPISSSGSATPPYRRGRGKPEVDTSPRRKDAEELEERDREATSEDTVEARSLPRQLPVDGDLPARPVSDDILICGTCRLFFDHVDELISHKMAGCSLGTGTCEVCRCRSTGEPSSLACAYCGAVFSRAWALVCHCRVEHGILIYAMAGQSSAGEDFDEATADAVADGADASAGSAFFDDDAAGVEVDADEQDNEEHEEASSNEVTSHTAGVPMVSNSEDDKQQEDDDEGLDGIELVPSPSAGREGEGAVGALAEADDDDEEVVVTTRSNGVLEEDDAGKLANSDTRNDDESGMLPLGKQVGDGQATEAGAEAEADEGEEGIPVVVGGTA